MSSLVRASVITQQLQRAAHAKTVHRLLDFLYARLPYSSHLYLVGGHLRRAVIRTNSTAPSAKTTPDLDVVCLGISPRELDSAFRTLPTTRSSHGAKRGCMEGINFDIWTATQQKGIYQSTDVPDAPPESIRSVLECFLLNCDSVAADPLTSELFEYHFRDALNSRLIDVNPRALTAERDRALDIAHVARIQRTIGFGLTQQLARFVCTYSTVANLSRAKVYLKNKCVGNPKGVLAHLVAIAREVLNGEQV